MEINENLELQEYAPGADLSGKNLSGANLSGKDMTKAILKWAILSGTDLSSAILQGADMRWTDLTGSTLDGADLTGAKMSSADLTGATLLDTTLIGADMRWTNLSDATLTGADLTGAWYDVYTEFPQGFDPVKHGMIKVVGYTIAAEKLELVTQLFNQDVSRKVSSAFIEEQVCHDRWSDEGHQEWIDEEDPQEIADWVLTFYAHPDDIEE